MTIDPWRDEEGGGTPYTPHPMHECQNKGDRKWAIHKCMKRKNEDRCGVVDGEFQNGNCWYAKGLQSSTLHHKAKFAYEWQRKDLEESCERRMARRGGRSGWLASNSYKSVA